MARHRIVIQTPLAPGPIAVEGEEAHHAARVKRLEPGDAVELLDGRGGVGEARVVEISKSRGARGQWRVDLEVEAVRTEELLRPRLEVWSPAPKGARLADMIDGLSQVGAALWGPLETERTVTEPRAAKLERLDRTALEAAKQCGRAWVLEIGEPAGLERVLGGGGAVVVADAGGGAYRATGAGTVRLLGGPEGGWTAGELERARSAGAQVCRFGPHVMRIETAAVAASAVVLGVEAFRGHDR